MRPMQGDSVKFTDRFINNTSILWVPALRDVELSVANVKLKTMAPFKIYTIFIIANGMMYKVDVNETGHYVDQYNNVSNSMVFEQFNVPNVTVSAPAPAHASTTPAWSPNSTPVKHKPVTVDETNSVCTKCGSPALDMGFKVMCTNPNCENYG